MTDTSAPTPATADAAAAADDRFFAALLAADGDALAALLAADFVLVDVGAGGVIPGSALVPLVASRELVFLGIDVARDERNVRVYGDTAVVVGRTRMHAAMGGDEIDTPSRYTHVYVRQHGEIRMVSAQGTAILDPPA